MAERVVLHIGGPKCGTTYLQTVLWSNQHRLAEAGVLLPGARMFSHNLAATWARTPKPKPRAERAWQRMLAQVRDHPGTAVYSNEWFTMADAEGASRVLEAFGDAEVHLVFTARDLVGLVPAAWQEVLKLGHGGSLGEFVDGLADPDQRWCWWTLDPAEVLERWAVPPERVHLVTLPAAPARAHGAVGQRRGGGRHPRRCRRPRDRTPQRVGRRGECPAAPGGRAAAA